MKYTVNYEGDLRTKIVHEGSKSEILSDAPKDNKGQGRYFSPTDLMSASLASCMMTIIGITAANHKIELKEMKAEAEKHMATHPRRVGRIAVKVNVSCTPNDKKSQQLLITAAKNCPVAKSIHPDIHQDVRFTFS